MQIRIPQRLKNHLLTQEKWYSCVTSLQNNIEVLLAKDPEFFPDYTLHGIGHINEVLINADKLISKNTLPEALSEKSLLKPRDIAFLVCAIMIHDLGMFLRQDGVKKLIQGSHRYFFIKGFNDNPWDKAWSEYVDKTKRFSQEKMKYHFGRNITLTKTCIDKSPMDDDDKRVIGEFLRQNHARLAHEIAVNNMPGSEDINVFKNTDFSQKDRDLIGLLARSHGMAIRDTESYLKDNFNKGSKPHNTPVFYLMAVLRLADYLDACELRAPKDLEKQQKIHVPISVEEWSWNQCIDRDICDWIEEQKNYYIGANPETSIEYVQLEKWLRNVQAELDLCWSVLAEQYPYDRYKLSIHRITCNIWEPGVRERMNCLFLTKDVRVTANPEIIKLMMAPLYGDNPTYGIRELLQNAIDACLERKKKEDDDATIYQGKVSIRIDPYTDPGTNERIGKFTIIDNGIGMNEDVLLNYYLSAGSSYRNSEHWKANFASDKRSQVARTGRFGIGFLAAFLLGDTIRVHTQHRDDDIGYTFEFDNQSKPLNIVRKKRDEGTGTTIEIQLAKGVLPKLERSHPYPWYSWFAFDIPDVNYSIHNRQKHHEGLTLFRDPKKNSEWLTLKTNSFESFQWKPNKGYNRSEFYCNGIRIFEIPLHDYSEDGLDVSLPHISLIDTEAILHVDLARAKVETVPEAIELAKQVFCYYIAMLLITPWSTLEDFCKNIVQGFPLRQNTPFLLCAQGFTLNYVSMISAMGIDRCVILYYDGNDPRTVINSLPNTTPCSIVLRDSPTSRNDWNYSGIRFNHSSPSSFAEAFLSKRDLLFSFSFNRFNLQSEWTDVWLQKDVYLNIHEYRRTELKLDNVHPMANGYIIHRDNTNYGNSSFAPHFPYDEVSAAFQIQIDRSDYGYKTYGNLNSHFVRTLQNILIPANEYDKNDLWIPFEMEERKKKFPNAFEELAPYINYIHQEWRLDEQRRLKQEEHNRLINQSIAENRENDKKKKIALRIFAENHRQEIEEMDKLLSQSSHEEFLQYLAIFFAKVAVANFLSISFEKVTEDSIHELTDFFKKYLADNIDPTDFGEPLDLTPEEIVELVYEIYEDLSENSLMEDTWEDEAASKILSYLNKIRINLKE